MNVIDAVDAAPDLAARIVAGGVRLFRIETGVAGRAFDVMRLEALGKRHPDAEIRVDYNQGLTPLEAMRFVPAIGAGQVPIGERHS